MASSAQKPGYEIRDGEWLERSRVLQGGCGRKVGTQGAEGDEGRQLEVKDQGNRGNEGEGGRARRDLMLGRKWPGSGLGISFRWVRG